ncbi:MAG TPA: tetratricopeptide repeat protein [Pyrinomonadaceae bacterium]|nr:tetratricopeptide repeat protein [Pyrinomonadaceae bacterium]
MPDQLVQFKTSPLARIILLLTVLLALTASWFVMRWYFGNTLAEYFNPEEARLQTARTAVSLAPSDPLTHWRLGDFIHKRLPPDQISQAVAEFERAVALSPNDYRYWTAWGQALEQAGDYEKAEKALREAVRLAPAYSFPRWHLGNLLMRRSRYDEAFSELRYASEANDDLQPQLFGMAWQLYGADPNALQAAIGNRADIRARFALYLIQRSHFDEGLRLWNTLSESEKKTHRPVAESVISNLIMQKRFHAAAEFWNEVAPGDAYRAEIGRIIDPSFENNISHNPSFLFGWQVPSINQVQVGITPNVGHNSNRSLRMFFQVRSHLEPIAVTQLIPVHPNTGYSLDGYAKTEQLVSASTPAIVIEDPVNGAQLAASGKLPTGDNEWSQISLPFTTGPKTEAIRLKIYRATCGRENPVCPIFGTVWYDDFALKSGK